MRNQDVERLIAKYMDGHTSPEEEKRLALALDSAIERGDAPQEWRAVAQMLGDLTLGEAIYDKMLAKRRRKKISGWASLVAAACVALLLGFWFVPQSDTEAYKPLPLVDIEVPLKPTEKKETKRVPLEKELPTIAEVKPARKSRTPTAMPMIAEEMAVSEESGVESVLEETIAEEDVPVVQEVAEETSTAEEIDIEELRRKYSKEIAQVERNYYEWEKKQSISLYKAEMNAVGEKTEQQYVKYIKKDNNVKDNIINNKPLPI
ncbi:MAG: hypothetical protein J1F40_00050 [Prevotellaceae bacterium]|nr:hypothetical protein [Prevotellaceae bacterium]